jgi:proteasome activator subunit 4
MLIQFHISSWMTLKYPIQTSTRARLASLYYELTLLPGIEARATRSWADMLTRLTNNKPNQKRKLESTDLILQWKVRNL